MSFSKTLVSLRWLVVLCLAAFTLSGCGLLPDLKEFLPNLEEPPKVSLSNIQIDSEDVVVVSLWVMNPNDASLDIQSMSCSLELNVNDKTFALEAATNAFTLEPNSSVEVPVYIPDLTANAVSNLAHMLWSSTVEGEPATYALEGALESTLPLKIYGLPAEVPLEVSFSCTGNLQDKAIHYDLESALKVKVPFVPDPKLVKWSSSDDISINELIGGSITITPEISVQIKTIDGATIDISLLFPLPNGVDHNIQSITCGLSLNAKGKTFALGAATGAFTLEPNGSVKVPIKITSLTADAASGLASILWSCITEGEPAIYALQGTLALNFYGSPVEIPFSSIGALQLSIQGKAIHYELKGLPTVE